MHDGDVGESGDAKVGFADGKKSFEAGEKAGFAGNGWSDDFASGPPQGSGLAGNERGFDGSFAVGRGAAGDEAG